MYRPAAAHPAAANQARASWPDDAGQSALRGSSPTDNSLGGASGVRISNDKVSHAHAIATDSPPSRLSSPRSPPCWPCPPGLYVDAPNWVQQARGTDLATLFLAVPVLAVGLWTGRRGSAVGRLAVMAGLLYLVYNYAIFAFSVAMNPLTAVHIAIFGLSLWSLVLAGRAGGRGGRRRRPTA